MWGCACRSQRGLVLRSRADHGWSCQCYWGLDDVIPSKRETWRERQEPATSHRLPQQLPRQPPSPHDRHDRLHLPWFLSQTRSLTRGDDSFATWPWHVSSKGFRSTRLSWTMWHPRSTRQQFRQTAPTSPTSPDHLIIALPLQLRWFLLYVPSVRLREPAKKRRFAHPHHARLGSGAEAARGGCMAVKLAKATLCAASWQKAFGNSTLPPPRPAAFWNNFDDKAGEQESSYRLDQQAAKTWRTSRTKTVGVSLRFFPRVVLQMAPQAFEFLAFAPAGRLLLGLQHGALLLPKVPSLRCCRLPLDSAARRWWDRTLGQRLAGHWGEKCWLMSKLLIFCSMASLPAVFRLAKRRLETGGSPWRQEEPSDVCCFLSVANLSAL